jgi:uncharacterized protein
MQVNHVLIVLAVDSVEVARTFYQGVFGWRAAVEVPVYVELELPHGLRLGLYQREAFAHTVGRQARRAGEELTGAELYLRVDDLDEAEAALARAGAQRVSARAHRSWGDEAAYYVDPDGHVVAVSQPRD